MPSDTSSSGPRRASPQCGGGRAARTGAAVAPTGDRESVARALTAFVNANIMARGRPIRPEDDFERAGVDSMGLLRLLLYVETEFGFWMPDEDLVEENIGSAHALASYICRRHSEL
jgi:acyl carrier protein